ncbi:SDR family oxidoreductase [Enterococcus sp. SMC-9]|uniref:SDR family oxidoreductase n=1 Tax=Enterococcus sp. SMC-9 TaxID=2862343 RepID=UPI001E3F9CBF|nr:SDR family oxidoreductase [Enterococcus sp. SMC-9]MCD1023976.1 SDR family oxidoreductase [Enterococcus sp. SMC-9]
MSINEVVIVTGASSGIGKATVVELSKKNFHVIAGVLKEEELKLFTETNVEPVLLDITNEDDIASLVRLLNKNRKTYKIVSLINNAGIEFNAPFELLKMEDWRNQFDVNLFGQVALTKALLPFLRKSHGSIVNITSVGGKVAMPNYSAYAATKFAFEAASDSLRRELKDQKIKVVIVEPGGIQTEMAAYSGDLSLNFEKTLSVEDKKLYSNLIKSAVASQSNFLKHAMTAEKAGKKVAAIATKKKPRTRYSLGMDAKMTLPMVRFFPTKFVDWILELNRKLT